MEITREKGRWERGRERKRQRDKIEKGEIDRKREGQREKEKENSENWIDIMREKG